MPIAWAGTLGGGVSARIGDLRQPADELSVQIVEIAKASGEEKVLAHIALGSFDQKRPAGLCSDRRRRARQETRILGLINGLQGPPARDGVGMNGAAFRPSAFFLFKAGQV